MKKTTLLASLLVSAFLLPVFTLHAQFKVKQVLIANGGVLFSPGNQVTIGSYNPDSARYTLFDSIPGNDVTQILIDGKDTAYMATDSTLVQYDLNTLKRLNSVTVFGLRHIAIYKNYVVASIGFDGNFNHFKMFRKSDLGMVYKERNIPAFCEGITVQGDSAYLAVQGDYPQYNDTGKIAVIDLVNQKVARIISLGADAKGIGQLFSNDSTVLGVTEYPTAVLSKISLTTGKVSAIKETVYTPFGFMNNNLYGTLEDTKNSELGDYNVYNSHISAYITPSPSYAAAAYDSVDKEFFLTGAQYSRPAKAYIYSNAGKVLDSFNIGTSPEGIAIQYEPKPSGIHPDGLSTASLQIYPNPAGDQLHFSGIQAKNASISILDLSSKVLWTKTEDLTPSNAVNIPLNTLPQGMYLLQVKGNEGVVTQKFIRQ